MGVRAAAVGVMEQLLMINLFAMECFAKQDGHEKTVRETGGVLRSVLMLM